MLEVIAHMSALADPTRCRMLLLLERHELTVSELCAVLQMPQSSVSRQLKTLADDRWIASRRDATSRFYSMPADDLEETAARLWPLVRDHVSQSKAALHDARRLEGVLARRRSTSREFFASSAGQWDRLRETLFGESFYLWALLDLLDPQMTVGDLGCGTGQLTAILAPHVRRVVAVDGSTDMLETARTRVSGCSNVEVRKGELEALPLRSGELDLAVLSLVLHHAPDPATALSEVARVCRPGGRVLVVDMVPHHHEEYRQTMGHVWLGFSAQQMTKSLTAAGFENARVRSLPVVPDAKGPALFSAVATRTGAKG